MLLWGDHEKVFRPFNHEERHLGGPSKSEGNPRNVHTCLFKGIKGIAGRLAYIRLFIANLSGKGLPSQN